MQLILVLPETHINSINYCDLFGYTINVSYFTIGFVLFLSPFFLHASALHVPDVESSVLSLLSLVLSSAISTLSFQI